MKITDFSCNRCVKRVFYSAFVWKCTDMCKHRFGVQLLQNPPLCRRTVKIRCSPLLQYTKLKAICQEKYGEIIHVAKYSFTRISVRIVYHVLALKNWTVQRTGMDWWLMHAYIFYTCTCTVAWKMAMQILILCITRKGSNFILNFRLLLIMEINLLF